VGWINRCSFLGNLRNTRQPDREGRAATDLAFHRDVAAHHLTEAFADREAEAGTAVFPRRRRISLGELLKQLAHLLRRHADAGIGDSDGDPIAAVFPRLARVNGNGAALRKLVGVAHEVEQRLPQPQSGRHAASRLRHRN